MVVSSVAVGLIWLMILDPNIGPLNAIVKSVGLTPPILGWLGDPNVAIWMLLVVAAWQYTGFMMVLVLAGLQGVPERDLPGGGARRRPRRARLLVHHAAGDPEHPDRRRPDHHDRRASRSST